MFWFSYENSMNSFCHLIFPDAILIPSEQANSSETGKEKQTDSTKLFCLIHQFNS